MKQLYIEQSGKNRYEIVKTLSSQAGIDMKQLNIEQSGRDR